MGTSAGNTERAMLVESSKNHKQWAKYIHKLANNPEYREQYDYVTTRAVSNLSTIAEYMIPFLKIGGKAICMKGPNYEEELKEAEKAINILSGKIEKIENLLISDEIERNIIIISKIRNGWRDQ